MSAKKEAHDGERALPDSIIKIHERKEEADEASNEFRRLSKQLAKAQNERDRLSHLKLNLPKLREQEAEERANAIIEGTEREKIDYPDDIQLEADLKVQRKLIEKLAPEVDRARSYSADCRAAWQRAIDDRQFQIIRRYRAGNKPSYKWSEVADLTLREILQIMAIDPAPISGDPGRHGVFSLQISQLLQADWDETAKSAHQIIYHNAALWAETDAE